MPLMTIIFGQFTGKFADFAGGSVDTDDFKSEVNSFLLWFIYLFVAKFVTHSIDLNYRTYKLTFE